MRSDTGRFYNITCTIYKSMGNAPYYTNAYCTAYYRILSGIDIQDQRNLPFVIPVYFNSG
ncbi:hypothetical protein SAMN05428949_4492 [Chitinophaga sp. YR627]|nr:hypothetical protein SAMN05428949_4492 [Chitinophaga sp. YR627]